MSTRALRDGLWNRVASRLRAWAGHPSLFRYGQGDSLAWIATRIEHGGFVLADEVGLGKTRLSLLVMVAALEEGANVVAVVPPGLMFQWHQEAADLQRELDRLLPGSSHRWTPILVRSYDGLFDVDGGSEYPLADHRRGRWVLLSQTFDIYRPRRGARAQHFELPALVRACWERKKQAHGHNRWLAYEKTRSMDGDEFLVAGQRAAKYLAKLPFSAEMKGIFEDERLRPYTRGITVTTDACSAFFQSNQPGRKLLMHLVGRLVGPVDLLVMDEAHKSREEGDEPQKRLGRLLGEVLQSATDSRRISMSATPIELNAGQWRSLLKRTGIGADHPSWPTIDAAISEFARALAAAGDRPDQPAALDELLLAAGHFESALRPFVTRRRRLHQAEMQALLPSALPPGAHPHRELRTHVIDVEALGDDWRRFVLAAEGRGLASKGLADLGHGERQADIRYASGLGTARTNPQPGGADGGRKHQRAKAWRALQERLEGTEQARLWTHPRVVAAADRVEDLCAFNGVNPTEKVLVFGTFSRPMEALRDLLNARHTLRVVDHDRVAPLFAPLKSPELLQVAYEGQRRGGRFTGRLAGAPVAFPAVLDGVREAHARYEAARDALRAHFHAERSDWVAAQPGGKTLTRLAIESRGHYDGVFETLRSEVFDVLLFEGNDPSNVSPERIDALAHQAWVQHLFCILHGDEEEVLPDEVATSSNSSRADDLKLRQLDALADRMDSRRVTDYFVREPRSPFCRLLDGDVAPKTRQAVQASFNRREVGPYVLVAQSMVGREGLNLHRACRRVFLFHPEWNPGVMEQQVGRVDRIESLWTRLAAEWIAAHGADEVTDTASFPRIEVESLVFRGTYDEYQGRVLQNRRASLNAQLFGALLDEAAQEQVPEDYKSRLAAGAPDFGPLR